MALDTLKATQADLAKSLEDLEQNTEAHSTLDATKWDEKDPKASLEGKTQGCSLQRIAQTLVGVSRQPSASLLRLHGG